MPDSSPAERLALMHTIVFPRYEDIRTRARTLLHWSLSEDETRIRVGDKILLAVHESFPRAIPSIVTEVTEVRLLDVVDADLALIGNVTKDEYLRRWDSQNPTFHHSMNPMVARVIFTYDTTGW